MPKKGKIKLKEVTELQGPNNTIVQTQAELDIFLGKLRQDWFSLEQLQANGVMKKLSDWLALRKRGQAYFLLVVDDPNDFGRNDGWGDNTVFGCIAFLNADGSVVIVRKLLHGFAH